MYKVIYPNKTYELDSFSIGFFELFKSPNILLEEKQVSLSLFQTELEMMLSSLSDLPSNMRTTEITLTFEENIERWFQALNYFGYTEMEKFYKYVLEQGYINESQKLEAFIRQNLDKIKTKELCLHATLSDDFWIRFIDSRKGRIPWDELFLNTRYNRALWKKLWRCYRYKMPESVRYRVRYFFHKRRISLGVADGDEGIYYEKTYDDVGKVILYREFIFQFGETEPIYLETEPYIDSDSDDTISPLFWENYMKNEKVDWDRVCLFGVFPIEFWRHHKDKINWRMLSHNPAIQVDFLIENDDKINWRVFSTNSMKSRKILFSFDSLLRK